MNIALDAMGGDFAPDATIAGAKLALAELPPQARLILVGQQDVVEKTMKMQLLTDERVSVVDAPQVITMGEHATKALKQKPQSSIAVGVEMVKRGHAQAFCSAGNTGAMLVASVFILKPVPNVLRPAIGGLVPQVDGSWSVLLDVGANAECKPEYLEQFAEIGTLYAKHVMGINNPRVGLLNLGEEEQKGTAVTQATYQLLKNNSSINFMGNIEGHDFFRSKADVLVADGYVGNVVYKTGESFYHIMKDAKLDTNRFIENLNYEAIGGSPILGVNGSIIIGHGISSPIAIKNMILQAVELTTANFNARLASEYNFT